MKIFLLTLFLSLNVFASTQTKITGTYAPGLRVPRNLVQNPNCEKDARNITATSVSMTANTTSAPLNGVADCAWNPTATAQIVSWALDSLPTELKGQNCEARIKYAGDASLVSAFVKSAAGNVATGISLTNANNSSATASINYPCGDGTAYSVVLQSTGDAAAAQYMAYAGEATNIQNVSSAGSMVVGQVFTTGEGTCPANSFAADGSAKSRTVYSDLFSKYSTTYGTGDGSTTFNIPNIQGVFVRGAGSQTISSISYTGTRGTTQGDQVQGHYHAYTSSGVTNVSTNALADAASSGGSFTGISKGPAAGGSIVIGSPSTDGSNGTPRTGSETRPANVSLLYCVVYLGGDNATIAITSRLPTQPTRQKILSGTTFTTAPGASALLVRGCGAGGGGGGGGTTLSAGGNGTSTTFSGGTVSLTGGGGTGGPSGVGAVSTGGTVTITGVADSMSYPGSAGQGGTTVASSTQYAAGGAGGNSPLFAGGGAGAMAAAGTAGTANSGAGSAGGGATNAASSYAGAGGASGGCFEALIKNPLTAYTISIGSGGALGAAGTSGSAGARGADGVLDVTTYYQGMNAPVLVGSVTSNSLVAERIERAELNCDASSSITSQSGTWLATIGNRSTAACAITIATGFFSSTPTCTFTTKAATVQATSVNMTSATAGTVYGASADYDGYLMCMGPR